MINLSIIPNENLKDISLIYHFYEDTGRIPLEIFFNAYSAYQEGITIDNYDGETGNFITFKFDTVSKSLVNITFVSVNGKNIIPENFMENIHAAEGSYQFCLHDNKAAQRTYHTTQILCDVQCQNIMVFFGKADVNALTFHDADEHLSLGLDTDYNLKSILLKKLEKEQIKQILNL